MTNPTTTTSHSPANEALDIAQRFATALADLRGEPIDLSHPKENAFIIARMGLCVTSIPGPEIGVSLSRLDRMVAQLGIDCLSVRIVVTRSSKQVVFDAVLRSGERTEVYPDLRLLIDDKGAFWLVPGSRKAQGLMAGRSGLLPVREATEFCGAEREAGLAAGVRYLTAEPD